MPNADALLPRASESVVCASVSEGAILYSGDTERYFGINGVGELVWQLLGECSTEGELYARMQERFPDVPRERIQTDVRELLDELLRFGLVQLPRPTIA